MAGYLDGRSGAVLATFDTWSHTQIEQPVIANFDDDCAPEILFSTCYDRSEPGGAMRLYECPGSATARPIVNQQAWHPAHVDDAGRILTVTEPPRWWGRQQGDCGIATSLAIECPADAVVRLPDDDDDCLVEHEVPAAVVTAASPCGVASYSLTDDAPVIFGLGRTEVTQTATDATGGTASCRSLVTVVDATPPHVVSVDVEPACLWPPRRGWVSYRLGENLRLEATDNCGGSLVIAIATCTSSELDDVTGDGRTTDDCLVTGNDVFVRAERRGDTGTPWPGRTYTIGLIVTDSSGNAATASVSVHVPHDRRDRRCETSARHGRGSRLR